MQSKMVVEKGVTFCVPTRVWIWINVIGGKIC